MDIFWFRRDLRLKDNRALYYALKNSKEVQCIFIFDPHILKKLKNGTFKGTFDLPKESTYEFKYLIDGEYVNEAEADRYQWNDFAGSENAVLEI